MVPNVQLNLQREDNLYIVKGQDVWSNGVLYMEVPL